MDEQKRIKAHCNACAGERNHDILHSETTTWQDDRYSIDGGDRYSTLRCCGCDAICLRHHSWFSEEEEPSITYHPPAMFRRRPKWLHDLEVSVDADSAYVPGLLKEIYVAIQNDLPSLSAMGIRALLERVMIAKSGDHGSFGKNIAAFEGAGYVSRMQRRRLETILEVGHATMHRTFTPKSADVVTLMDITEHIIESVYVHEEVVGELAKRIPARKLRGDG